MDSLEWWTPPSDHLKDTCLDQIRGRGFGRTVTFVCITCTLESLKLPDFWDQPPLLQCVSAAWPVIPYIVKRPVTLTPAIFSGVACDTFLLSGLFPLHFLTAWARQTLIAPSNRIAASLQVAKHNFHLSVKHLLKWSWITSRPYSHLISAAHLCSQSPHPSAGEPPVQTLEAEQLRSLLVLPFLSGPRPMGISLHHWMSIYAHFQRKKNRWSTSAKIRVGLTKDVRSQQRL